MPYAGDWGRDIPTLLTGLLLAACASTLPVVDPASERTPVVTTEQPAPGIPRALDPLTQGERQLAVRLALADQRVQRIAGGRSHDVAFAELLIEKPADLVDDADRPPPLPRKAEVLISVFERRFTGVRVVVDLARQAVEDVAELPSAPSLLGDSLAVGTPVPISPAEADLARQLALAHVEFRSLVAVRPEEVVVEFLPITMVDREFCPSGRCLELLFRRGDAYATTTAIVDIPTRAVRFRRGER